MNDMRLPGVSPFTQDTGTNQPSAEASRDAAQAFDAVMSRFAGERPRPQTTVAQDKGPPKPADKPQDKIPDKAPGKARESKGTPADAAPVKDKKTSGAKDTDAAHGKPVARSKAEATDEDAEQSDVQGSATTDPAALTNVAVVVTGTPLPAPVSALPVGDAAGTQVEPGNESKAATRGGSPLDVFAAETNAAGRNTGKPANDPRIAIGGDGETSIAAPNPAARRAPTGTKDTLRIDAPLMRAMDGVQAEFAQRAAVTASPLARSAVSTASTQMGQIDTTQMITAALAAAGSSTTTTGTYSIAHAAVGAPVGSPAFADELSQQVVMFAGQKLQRADIAVTPADLGPIAVSIEVRGHEATLAFAAASHTTRAAIEDALPRLREMLSAQGLQLAGTHVGSEPRRDAYRPARNDSNGIGGRRASDAVNAVAASDTPAIRRRVNLIDIEV